MYYPCSGNKGADQLRSYCAFVCALAKIWFSHDAAQIVSVTHQIKESSDKILKTVQSREEQVSMVERLQRLLLEAS